MTFIFFFTQRNAILKIYLDGYHSLRFLKVYDFEEDLFIRCAFCSFQLFMDVFNRS